MNKQTMTVIFMRGSASVPVIQVYHANSIQELEYIKKSLERDFYDKFKMYFSIA